MLAGIPAPHTPGFATWVETFLQMSESEQAALLTSIMAELTSIETQKATLYHQHKGDSEECGMLLMQQRNWEDVMLHLGVPVMYRDGVCYPSDR